MSVLSTPEPAKAPPRLLPAPVAAIPAPIAVAPIPPHLAAERARANAIITMTPKGVEWADEECQAAIRSGASVEVYRETLAVREVGELQRWLRGGS